MGSRRQDGFALLEVLVAFVIAALALGVMFEAAVGGLRATDTAGHYQEALSLARSHLADAAVSALAGRDESGEDGRGFRWQVRVVPVGTATLARSADEDPAQAPQAQATLYAISVVESWQGGGGERQVRLDTTRLAAGAARGG